MNKVKPQFMAAILVLLLAALACNFSASTANISDAWIARDEAGAERTTVFAPDEAFYAMVELANAPDDTTVKATWTAVDVSGVDANTFLDEAELTQGSGVLTFSLTNDQLWPAGKYKVDLHLNGELDRTLELEVLGESPPPPTDTPVPTDTLAPILTETLAPDPTQTPTEEPKLAYVEVTNRLGVQLTVKLRGPEIRTFMIAGQSQMTLEITPGEYSYTLSATGYNDVTDMITFIPGDNTWSIGKANP